MEDNLNKNITRNKHKRAFFIKWQWAMYLKKNSANISYLLFKEHFTIYFYCFDKTTIYYCCKCHMPENFVDIQEVFILIRFILFTTTTFA